MDEFANYRNPDDSIDWGKYSMDKFRKEMEERGKKSIVELEDLNVFKLADELSDIVWEIVLRWEKFAKDTVGNQWVRSADSVGANIAEGYGRYFFGEYIVFLYYSRGSLKETEYWTEKAEKRNLLTDEEYSRLKDIISKLPKELNATIKNIKLQQKKWPRR